MASEGAGGSSAAVKAGERLFFETRFTQFFSSHGAGGVNIQPIPVDPSLSGAEKDQPSQAVSCQVCHAGGQQAAGGEAANSGGLSAELTAHSTIPRRMDGRLATPRNSPSLPGAILPGGSGLLHFDGEFATAEDLVKGTFFGRNFGWLPGEEREARKQFARIIREDDGSGELASRYGRLSYATLFRATDSTIPASLRLPPEYRFDPAAAKDDEIIEGCARVLAAYLRSLQFSHDAEGLHDGSPYDAFLAANRLPRAPRAGESAPEYSRRLRAAVAALRAPQFVDAPAGPAGRAVQFGKTELAGMQIFFREAIGRSQTGGAGNCAECHTPPHFTDFAFHNTGVAQEDFDARNGSGAFAKLVLPGAKARAADYDRWLQPTAAHPKARGNFLFPSALAGSSAPAPGLADLGVWNVYANPDLPAPQRALEQLLNRDGHLSPDDVLALTVGRFKTSTVRGLGESAPYLHTGQLRTIEDVVKFYQRASALAHEGWLRNPPPEFFGMRLADEDVAPLAAFLRALDDVKKPLEQGTGSKPSPR